MDKYRNFLASVKELTNREKRELSQAMGSARAVYEASFEEIIRTNIVNEIKAGAIVEARKRTDLDEEVEKLQRKGIKAVFWDESKEEPGYPEALRFISDSPYGLYYIGNLPEAHEHVVAVVGARACTDYGRINTIELSKALCMSGYSTVSGMAYGIDKACHTGSLEAGGKTYAVLGCGVDVCYPEGNRGLYEKIKNTGGVISEFYPGTVPLPDFFPRRNRLISGLSFAVLVMEAKLRSGSLITANLALDQGRSVFALPGRVTDPLSAGTNHIINEGAGVIESKEQILGALSELLGYQDIRLPEDFGRKDMEDRLDENSRKVFDAIGFEPVSMDEIMTKAGLSIMEIIKAVMDLSGLGLIRETYVNTYMRVL